MFHKPVSRKNNNIMNAHCADSPTNQPTTCICMLQAQDAIDRYRLDRRCWPQLHISTRFFFRLALPFCACSFRRSAAFLLLIFNAIILCVSVFFLVVTLLETTHSHTHNQFRKKSMITYMIVQDWKIMCK